MEIPEYLKKHREASQRGLCALCKLAGDVANRLKREDSKDYLGVFEDVERKCVVVTVPVGKETTMRATLGTWFPDTKSLQVVEEEE